MYIDKLQPFWTDAERKAVQLNNEKAEALRLEWGNYEVLTREWLEVEQELSDVIENTRNIRRVVLDRYIDSFKSKPNRVLKDVKEIVNATTQEEFIEELNRRKFEINRSITGIDAEGSPKVVQDFITDKWQRYFDESTAETYENFYYFLGDRCRAQLDVMARYDLDHEEYDKILHAFISQWYKKASTVQPIPSPHGKFTDAFAKMGATKPNKDRKADTALYAADSLQAVIKDFEGIKRGLTINAHKLLTVAMGEFANVNNFEITTEKTATPRLGVHFSFTEYAEKRGYDLTNKEQVKDARKSVKKDLQLLLNCRPLRWEETINGRVQNFDEMRMLGRVYLKGDVIYMEFTQSFGLYLSMLPLTQYSPGLLAIDGRNPNAYTMGLKMCEHYNMDNNKFKGNYNTLRVETLLKETNLPEYETILSQRGSWELKIKEPFEKALETLCEVGVLSSWAYTGKRGKALTDKEAYNITNYHEWRDLIVKFELKDPKDQAKRLEKKAHEKKKKAATKYRADKKTD